MMWGGHSEISLDLSVSFIQILRVTELSGVNLQMFKLEIRNLVAYLNINFITEKNYY